MNDHLFSEIGIPNTVNILHTMRCLACNDLLRCLACYSVCNIIQISSHIFPEEMTKPLDCNQMNADVVIWKLFSWLVFHFIETKIYGDNRTKSRYETNELEKIHPKCSMNDFFLKWFSIPMTMIHYKIALNLEFSMSKPFFLHNQSYFIEPFLISTT